MPYNALSMGMKTPLVTLTFKLVRARDQTCLLCEFGANTFSRSQGISFINKKNNKNKVTDSTKNRTLVECGNKENN